MYVYSIASNTEYMKTRSEDLYLVCVVNWQPVWLEYCWHAVNIDEQTLDICVLRKSLFLECTFDVNIVEKKM